VSCPIECPFYANNDEDEWHILFGCNESQRVWHESGLRNIIEPRLLASNDVKSLIFDLCRSESASIVGHFAMVVWCIWNHRNNWVWNGVKDTAKEVAMRAGHMIGEWSAINSLQQINGGSGMNSASRTPVGVGQLALRDSHGNQPLRWQKPHDGWWKCNVDASFSQNPYVVACGWCVRDAAGSVVAVGSNFYNFTATVAEGEALALLEALREAIARGWSNVVFESDSKVVVDAVHSNFQGNSELSSLISSIKLLLLCHSNFEVKFTKRQANTAAHTLARAACSWPRRMFFNSVPLCIEPLIINDMS
jgi:ribonuclease HI